MKRGMVGPGVHWVGNTGAGVMAGGVEYIDEPALVLMLSDLPVGQFQVFNGRTPMASYRFTPWKWNLSWSGWWC